MVSDSLSLQPRLALDRICFQGEEPDALCVSTDVQLTKVMMDRLPFPGSRVWKLDSQRLGLGNDIGHWSTYAQHIGCDIGSRDISISPVDDDFLVGCN